MDQKKKKKKGIHIGREEVKLSWFADDVILCMEIPNSSTKKLLGIINEFSEVLEHKGNIQKPVRFLYSNNFQKEKLGKQSHLQLH